VQYTHLLDKPAFRALVLTCLLVPLRRWSATPNPRARTVEQRAEMANMPLQDSWTLHYSERSNARARAQAFEEQVSGGVKQSHLAVTLPHLRTSLSSTLFAWADSDTLCMVEYTHVRLPMLRAFLRRTTPAVIARTAICRAEARIYFEFLDRCPTLIWHTPSGTHSQPASPSLSRPTTSSRVLPHHALSAPVAHSNLTTQPKLHASI
jgi:hypothetical protein